MSPSKQEKSCRPLKKIAVNFHWKPKKPTWPKLTLQHKDNLSPCSMLPQPRCRLKKSEALSRVLVVWSTNWLMVLCRPTALTRTRTRTRTRMHQEKNSNQTNWFSIENKVRPFYKTAPIHSFLQVWLKKMRGLYAGSRKAILVYQINAQAMEASQSLCWRSKTSWVTKRMTTHCHLKTSLRHQSLTWSRLQYRFIWCQAKKKWLSCGRSLELLMSSARRRNTWPTQAWQALWALHLPWCGRNEFHILTLSG